MDLTATPPGARSGAADRAQTVQTNCNYILAVAYEDVRAVRFRIDPERLDPRAIGDMVTLKRTLSHIGDIRHELDRLEAICRPLLRDGA